MKRGPETAEGDRRDPEPGAAGQPPDFRVGDRLVRPSLNRLVRDGEVARVEPKLMRVLVVLAERPRRVVCRSELLAEVWEARHVSDSTVTRAIATLRRLLGDDAHRPRFIETIPKRGYRLIAPVTPAAPGEPEVPAVESSLPAAEAGVDAATGRTLLDRAGAVKGSAPPARAEPTAGWAAASGESSPPARRDEVSEGWVGERKPSPFGVIAAAALGAAAAAALMALGGALVRGSRSGAGEATGKTARTETAGKLEAGQVRAFRPDGG